MSFRFKNIGFRTQVSQYGFRIQASRFRFHYPDFTFQVPISTIQVSLSRFQISGCAPRTPHVGPTVMGRGVWLIPTAPSSIAVRIAPSSPPPHNPPACVLFPYRFHSIQSAAAVSCDWTEELMGGRGRPRAGVLGPKSAWTVYES